MKNLRNAPNLLGTLLVAGMLTFAQSGFALKESAHSPFNPILMNGMPSYGSEINRVYSDSSRTVSTLKGTIHSPFSPILMNGIPFYGSEITLDARGSLAVVEGYPSSTQAQKVPFRAYLKREDVEINRVYSDSSRTVGEVEISKALASARTGDKLIIESGNESPNTNKVQRALTVAGYRIIHWFRIPGQPGDGC